MPSSMAAIEPVLQLAGSLVSPIGAAAAEELVIPIDCVTIMATTILAAVESFPALSPSQPAPFPLPTQPTPPCACTCHLFVMYVFDVLRNAAKLRVLSASRAPETSRKNKQNCVFQGSHGKIFAQVQPSHHPICVPLLTMTLPNAPEMAIEKSVN